MRWFELHHRRIRPGHEFVRNDLGRLVRPELVLRDRYQGLADDSAIVEAGARLAGRGNRFIQARDDISTIRDEVHARLAAVARLDELEVELHGVHPTEIGHNHPPEPLEGMLSRSDFQTLTDAIQSLRQDLNSSGNSRDAISRKSNVLRFALGALIAGPPGIAGTAFINTAVEKNYDTIAGALWRAWSAIEVWISFLPI